MYKFYRDNWCGGIERKKKKPPEIGALQPGIKAQVNDYLGARVRVSTSVFGYWLVIIEYRELGVQIPRISGHGCITRHCMH